ncbi:MAG: hypothetical protein SGI77_12800 [Pirellulaceae bacterium]|nr:hypothetical protein [Pirellulaceae bacterium]
MNKLEPEYFDELLQVLATHETISFEDAVRTMLLNQESIKKAVPQLAIGEINWLTNEVAAYISNGDNDLYIGGTVDPERYQTWQNREEHIKSFFPEILFGYRNLRGKTLRLSMGFCRGCWEDR